MLVAQPRISAPRVRLAPPPAVTPDPPPSSTRWNYWTMALYLAFYRVALVLVQPDTILPVCMLQLTDNPLLMGVASSLHLFCWTVPQSLSAFYTGRTAETKPLVSCLTVLHAVPWALLACYLMISWRNGQPHPHPVLTITLIYATVVTFSLLGGACVPPYMTMVGKTLAPKARIKLLGYVWSLSVVLTFGTTLLMERLIAAIPFPLNFAIVFLLGFAVLCLAAACWAETKEPDSPPVRAVHCTLRGYYLDVFDSIRCERKLRRFLAATMLSGFGLPLLMPFLAVHAVADLGQPPETIARYLLVLMIAQSVAAYLAGRYLADRSAVFVLWLSLATIALLSGVLLIPHLPGYVWIGYTLAGLAQGLFVSSFQPAMFEVSGRQEASVVIGITNTIRGPFYTLGPLLGGLLQMYHGFQAVVAICLVASSAATIAMYLAMSARSSPARLKIQSL